MNPDEIMAQYAGLEWRGTGFWPGTELASRCTAPEQQRRYRRLHVQITWRDSYGEPVKVPGPICIRGGKFFGLGLFAPITICT
ncbi:MAG: type I-U CRISPR-associated protein Cas5/Cas6 [Verrucomicrobia bacterium]|nr:type I-U CRISPR-associated protein Cas5/Cas6 [Verrucomicrobiota bacterium]